MGLLFYITDWHTYHTSQHRCLLHIKVKKNEPSLSPTGPTCSSTSVIHQYLWITFYLPGIVLSTYETSVNKTDKNACFHRIYILEIYLLPQTSKYHVLFFLLSHLISHWITNFFLCFHWKNSLNILHLILCKSIASDTMQVYLE